MSGEPSRHLVFEFTPDSMGMFAERVSETGFSPKDYLTMVIQSYMTPRPDVAIDLQHLRLGQVQDLIEALIEESRSDLYIRLVIGLILARISHKNN
jgi:hypothetical protein